MPSSFDRGDFGRVFQATSGTPGTYVDIMGRTRTEAQLMDGVEVFMNPDIASAYFHAGAAGKVTFQVDIEINEATLDVATNGHDDLDPAQPFGKLSSFRNDNQKTLAVQTFATNGRYFLQTPDLATVPEGAISAIYHAGSGEPSASIVVKMRVEP